MATPIQLNENWEWEVELASMWPDDYTLEMAMLHSLIVHDQVNLTSLLGVLDSLGSLYHTHNKLGKYGRMVA